MSIYLREFIFLGSTFYLFLSVMDLYRVVFLYDMRNAFTYNVPSQNRKNNILESYLMKIYCNPVPQNLPRSTARK